MDKQYRTSIKKLSGPVSDDDAYNNTNLLAHQLAKFYKLMSGKGHWYEKMERMKPLVGNLSGKKLLDLGTQIGTYVFYLANSTKFSIGVDFSHEALKKAIDLRKQLNYPNTYFVQANIASLPFTDETFDIIIGCDIVEHLVEKDLQCMLKESYRIIKNEGLLVLQTYPNRYGQFFIKFNKFSIIPILLFWLPKILYTQVLDLYEKWVLWLRNMKWKVTGAIPKGMHINCQTLKSISESVAAADFKIETAFAESTYSNYERTNFGKFVEKLLRNNIVTKQNIYLKARKVSRNGKTIRLEDNNKKVC